MKFRQIPTDQDYENYDGGHCKILWNNRPPNWHCPGCDRNKREILRWTYRNVNGNFFWGWIAPLATHHDHSGNNRFPETVICQDCNSADGAAKRKWHLPSKWSFSPSEIRQFINPTPHATHEINHQKALSIYRSISEGNNHEE